MLREGGYLISVDPDPTKSKGQQAVVENSTFTCGHCGGIVVVPPMCAPNDMPGATCWGCRRLICTKCDHQRVQSMRCDVIENKLERWEGRERMLRDMGA